MEGDVGYGAAKMCVGQSRMSLWWRRKKKDASGTLGMRMRQNRDATRHRWTGSVGLIRGNGAAQERAAEVPERTWLLQLKRQEPLQLLQSLNPSGTAGSWHTTQEVPHSSVLRGVSKATIFMPKVLS